MPNTSSPTRNSVTATPTSSTTPANSMPATVRLGRRMPVKTRVNRYSTLRTPIASPRVMVETWTLTSTSSSFGTGRSTSATRSTSGGPYRSWTTALMGSLPLIDSAAVDGCAVVPCPSGAVELGGPSAARPRSGRAAGRDHPAVLADEAAAEVRGVELHAPDRLVHRSELGQGEGRADEGRRDARHLELDPDALDRVADDSQGGLSALLSFVRNSL